jgi:hypothetical protein
MTLKRLTTSPKWLPTINCQLNLSTKNVNQVKLTFTKLKILEMIMKKLWITLIALNLAGCSFAPSKEQMTNADFGERPNSARATATITNYLGRTLIDPDSLRLRCADAEAKKGWAREVGDRQYRFGWSIYCEVNAKNRLGGYTGAKTHIFLFNGNNLVLGSPLDDAFHGFLQ